MHSPSLSRTARGIFTCTPEVIHEALAGYDNWHEWVPLVSSSRLLTREDILAVVELNMESSGGATLVECIQIPGSGLLARVIEGNSPVREIHWVVEAADDGFSRVTVTIRQRIGPHLLNFANWPVRNPAKYLDGLRAWISAAHPGPEAVSGGENLFELWETEAGLVCWIRGRKYKLTPAEDGRP